MKRAALFSIFALLIALPSIAIAQETSDPRGFRFKRQQVDHRDTTVNTPPQITLMRTAKCVAEGRPSGVSAYLATVPASAEEDAAFEALQSKLNRCIPEMDMSMVGNMQRAEGVLTLVFAHSSLRGALAESMLREGEVAISPAKLALGDDGMFVAERFHGQRSSEPERAFALGFAGCVMGNNSSTIEVLLATNPGSPEEKQAVMAMAPSFPQCVVEGQTLRLNASNLRNQIAEVVYYAHMSGSTQ